MTYLLLTIATLAHAASAEKAPAKAFTFRQERVHFLEKKAEKLLVSENCRKGQGLRCDAVDKLGQVSFAKLPREGGNPASLLCELQLKGTVVVGRGEHGDENSFCRFPDASFIDGGSLVYRARKNDEAAKAQTPAASSKK